MRHSGAIPGSAGFLNYEDKDGNQLWRVTCLKSQITDYMKVMKKNSFTCQEFFYDFAAYQENMTLRANY